MVKRVLLLAERCFFLSNLSFLTSCVHLATSVTVLNTVIPIFSKVMNNRTLLLMYTPNYVFFFYRRNVLQA